MKRGRKDGHDWDLILDTCNKCGLQMRVKQLYTKDGMFRCGKLTEYLVNNKWTSVRPECINQK